jgi:hypothetical protein
LKEDGNYLLDSVDVKLEENVVLHGELANASPEK